MSTTDATPQVAFVSAGQLHTRAPDGTISEVESPFAREYVQRAVKIQKKHAWKHEGRGARFMSGGMMWGAGAPDAANVRVNVKGVTRGVKQGELLYTLDTEGVSGLFERTLGGPDERRLYHSADFVFNHLSARAGGELALALLRKNGTAAIALYDGNTRTVLKEVTEGDTVDLAPSWHPDGSRRLVFQSAGVGRTAGGEWAGLAPFSIQLLDLEQSDMSTLHEEPNFDLLSPRQTKDGDLYFIRRPHGTGEASWLQTALDTLLIPFRLGAAIFQYLNFFTAMYTGKPLTSAGLPHRPGSEMKHLLIWGNVVDAEEAARAARRAGEAHPGLVPPSWELVRRARDGTLTTVAQGVLSFDLTPAGAPVWSNGNAIFRLDASGARELVLAHKHIDQVVVLGR